MKVSLQRCFFFFFEKVCLFRTLELFSGLFNLEFSLKKYTISHILIADYRFLSSLVAEKRVFIHNLSGKVSPLNAYAFGARTHPSKILPTALENDEHVKPTVIMTLLGPHLIPIFGEYFALCKFTSNGNSRTPWMFYCAREQLSDTTKLLVTFSTFHDLIVSNCLLNESSYINKARIFHLPVYCFRGQSGDQPY